MDQSFFQKLIFSKLSNEFPAFYATRKVSQYVAHNNPPIVLSLSQINPVPALPADLLPIDISIILLSTFRSSKWSLSFRLRNQNPVRNFLFSPYMPHFAILTVSLQKPQNRRVNSVSSVQLN